MELGELVSEESFGIRSSAAVTEVVYVRFARLLPPEEDVVSRVVDEEQHQQDRGYDAEEYHVHRHHEVALDCKRRFELDPGVIAS